MNIYQTLSKEWSTHKKIKKSLWKNIPREILHIILCYQGMFMERNGKFIARIMKYDTRYAIFQNIPRYEIISEDNLIMKICFSNRRFEMYKYVHETTHHNHVYNFETDDMISSGIFVGKDAFVFYKYNNPDSWMLFRHWLYDFQYSLKILPPFFSRNLS